MNVLVVAPHPDDEVLGCGGSIAKHTHDGDSVSLCIATEAYTPDWSEEYIQTKEVEIGTVTDLLGIDDVYTLGFQTAKCDESAQKQLNDTFREVVAEVDPDRVYLPHPSDLHHDHGKIFEAGLVATRPHTESVSCVYAYETVSETEWGYDAPEFSADVYVDISGYLEKKVEAMETYETEVRTFPHPRSPRAIRALAEKRGSEIAREAAEAFTLIRSIE